MLRQYFKLKLYKTRHMPLAYVINICYFLVFFVVGSKKKIEKLIYILK